MSKDESSRRSGAPGNAVAGRANDSTRPRTAAQRTGEHGEMLAADYLAKQGLRIVVRNYRVKGGEIDLVAEHGRALVFVEVRARRSDRFGGASESITAHKRRRVVLAARCFLATHPAYADRACRFDCVLLQGEADACRLEWIRDAFTAD